ncbi:MAG TPA: Lpg1974 family pore-forming outer membrane protein [Gemmataceae bacterium]|nr:Lpg1974 family pore-forming outer membrane protein [Gemmataceae bacterium]
MIRTSCPLVVLTMLGALLSVSRGFAQAPKSGTTEPALTADQAQPDPLPGLPQPPAIPGSLFQQPGPTPPYTCEPLAGPYFQPDARLDPPSQPPLGWFTDAELDIVGPHVKNRLTDSVTVGSRPPDIVHLGSADLDWTASPRFEVGYRLPAGFGAFALSYRFLATDGSGTIQGPDAPASLTSRLDVNVVDLDYVSWEFFTEQWPYCHMKWFFGVRYADVFFDSLAAEPFAAAAAGSGIFETRVSNNFSGAGPHAGVELTRSLGGSGLALTARCDGALVFGQLHQHFFENSTTLDASGQPLSGLTQESNPQTVPIINVLLGLSWKPPALPNASFSLGYVYEYWWDVGRLSTNTSRGEMSDQGIQFRAEWSF